MARADMISTEKTQKRSRYLINQKEKYIILVNFKCGFSTMCNIASQHSEVDASITNPKMFENWLMHNDISSYYTYFVSRDPLSRIISFYYSWIVSKDDWFFTKRLNKKIENKHFVNLKKVMNKAEYNRFRTASAMEKTSPELLNLFLRYLPEIYSLDPHTNSQHDLFSAAGLTISDIDKPLDISDISKEFSSLFNMDIPVLNKSAYKRKDPTAGLTAESLTVINNVYKHDYNYFGY